MVLNYGALWDMSKLSLQIKNSPITSPSFLVLDWIGDALGFVSVHNLTSSSLGLLISIKVVCLEFTAFSACAFLLAVRESLFTIQRERHQIIDDALRRVYLFKQ